MIALKKLYGDELLRLALILSLLKVTPEYLEIETQRLMAGAHISNGTDWSIENEPQTLIRPRFVHPKSLDNILLNYEQDLFEELNSLGRYSVAANNDRMWSNRPILHTYLVNNVATETVAPPLADGTEPDGVNETVSADDNVGQEIKLCDDDATEADAEESEADVLAADADEASEVEAIVYEEISSEPETEVTAQPDAVVTLSPDFLVNRTEDIFAEIASRSFDVNEFLVTPDAMHIKREQDDDILDVAVKREREDLFDDNAIDDYVPYFAAKAEKFEIGEPHDVFHQNMADLQDYSEFLEDVKELRGLDFLDVKQQQDNLEQYLLENTPLELDSDVYNLAPLFEEELVLDVKRERASTSFTSASSSGVSEMEAGSLDEASNPDVKEESAETSGDELTQADMDLIEVLWKQDVDMGFSLDNPLRQVSPANKPALAAGEQELKLTHAQIQEEDIEKVKAALLDPEVKEDDPWAGLSYIVDTETGEYVLQGALPQELVSGDEDRFELLEEALQLAELTETKDETPQRPLEGGSGEMLHPAMARHAMPPHHPLAHYHNQIHAETHASGGSIEVLEHPTEILQRLRHYNYIVGKSKSLMRSMSVEQRWQDLASLLTIPPPPPGDQYQHYHPHHPHHHHQHAHNMSAHGAAGYTPNYAPLGPPAPEKHPDSYGAAAPLDGAYKVESAHHPQQHDALYYQSGPTPEMGPTNQDGFLQSILNDEDLQLMDMAMNEGMYTMRVLDGGAPQPPVPHPAHTHTHMLAERDSASDSAVSSMGSERVPSLSDGEWCDGSDSAQEYHSSKFRPYDSSYGRDRAAPPHPQKKHHMFGKRCFQEPPQPLEPRAHSVIKYECPEQPTAYPHDGMHLHSVEFGARQQLHHAPPLQPALDLNAAHSSHTLLQSGVAIPSPAHPRYAYATPERVRHNHTYSAPALQEPRPVRDKRVRRLTDGSMSDAGSAASGHLSRDEKRAKALGIPMEVSDIINLPMDEFNERLSKHDLSEAQLSLIRDIRRRGKNKVAAQNCRKRKLDQITSLADEVRTMRDRKQRTVRDRHQLLAERQRVKERFAALYRHVFQNLRDPEGRPLSSSQFSLQQAADGNVVLVPKMPHHPDQSMNRTSDDEMDRKAKSYDQ